ncbi:MAG: MFS transporter [Myxococcaceae bacterium]|nr:MFS transporter [Myxococcaceae bacterium]
MSQFLPILVLLAAIGVVLWRLPQVDVGHSAAYKRRRFLNWFPLGMTYALLYFGRYNLSANASALDKLGLLTKEEYGNIDGWGSILYGVAFLFNGPLTDILGGRFTILLSAGGSALMNVLMGVVLAQAQAGTLTHEQVVQYFTVLFCANMYFQSFGAVSIVKVNAPWFHVRERGVLGGVFGILISLGLYFAYDLSRLVFKESGPSWAFYVPALVLANFFVIDFFLVRDSPNKAGFKDFDTGDASSGTEAMPLINVVVRMMSQKVIWVIVAIEFCSGFLRNAVMKWYLIYADKIGIKATPGQDIAFGDPAWISANWGVILAVAGITGGVFAGFISDHVFHSRRGPVATVLYAGMLLGAVGAYLGLGTALTGWSVVFMSLCVIGVHGMLSGTASADFGGKRAAGTATGIIDGFVYLGTGAQAFLYARILPKDALAKDPANWSVWPLAMLPVVVLGLLLALNVWNARPQSKAAAAH